MGVLNATPDSFFDRSRHGSLDNAISRGRAMVRDGCDIIDVGGESTRPGAIPVDAAEESDRVVPVVAALAELSAVPISIDTYKASVARLAVGRGAVVVNDVWGMQRDPDMASAVAETEAAVVVNHNRMAVDPDLDIMADMRRFFDRSLEIAARAGIPRDHVIIDPGFGFGKTHDQNLIVLSRLRELRQFDLPILVALSRKTFIGRILDAPVEDRLIGTLAANLACIGQGAAAIRVHDVAEHKAALRILTAMKGYADA